MLKDNNFSSFEIYENNIKIEYYNESSNLIILKKNNIYNFKYFPFNNNQLILNLFSITSNDFFYKSLYGFDSQNIQLNYYIEKIKLNDTIGLFFDIFGRIKIEGLLTNHSNFNNLSSNYDINSNEKFINIRKNINTSYLNIKITIYNINSNEFKIFKFHDIIVVSKINSKYNLSKGKNLLLLFDSELKRKSSSFESLILLSIRNTKNLIKLIDSREEIIISKTFLISYMIKLKYVFLEVKENDILEIQLISEKLSKDINYNIPNFGSNIIRQEKKFIIEYIHPTDYNLLFIEPINNINNNLKIFQLNNTFFDIDELVNNKFDNYIEIRKFTKLEPFNSYIIISNCITNCLYINYKNNIIDFEYILSDSQIVYLFMDFEYKIIFDDNVKNIKIKKLNNFENQLKIICRNKIINIDISEILVNVGECNGEFIIKGNNNLIYFYLPITLNKSSIIIKNETSFSLINNKEFFFVPNKSNCNYIDIFIYNKDYINNNKSLICEYYIDYNIIPYSKNIEKNYIIFEESVHISIPNYQQNSLDKDVYYIYFNFEKNNLNLEIYITYENIIKLDKNENCNLFISSGINVLQLEKQENYYINIIKKNISDIIIYSILRNYNYNYKEQNIKLDSDNIYFNSTSLDDNIRIKIKNENDLFLSFSSSPFYDLNMIYYDKNINIIEIKNFINIEFNTTLYESKIEYYVIITENINLNNMSDFLFHKVINSNSPIYKNIINSFGIEPISINVNIDKYLSYNKSYIIFVLGKENFGDTFHYMYYQPKEFNISNSEEEEEKNTDENSDESQNDDKNKGNVEEDNNTTIILVIVGIISGIIAFFALIFAVKYFLKKSRDNEYNKLLNDINSNLHNFE